MHPVDRYLTSMGEIRRTGAAVPETSYYGALETLLNEVGGELSPRVRAVLTLRDEGAGLPDGGFFTADQIAGEVEDPLAHVNPARGVVEVKAPGQPVAETAASEQVRRYAERYGQVLVTNYRAFLLVSSDGGGVRQLEQFQLAADPGAFWSLTGQPHALDGGRRADLVDFLKRVMLWPAPIREPADLAWILASYAREGRRRVETTHLGTLAQVREALEGALGVDFRGERGEHFFQSTLVQTLFYGIFSAWVLWHREDPDRTDRFDWRLAEWSLRVPMIRALFERVASASQIQALGLTDILGWASAALNRVDRSAFFRRFEEHHAVQYFYEPFLEAFDPELRKELGVWYTPPEVVRYMVERVDRALREELAIPDGLADDRVVVLDPCCGTGAYLVEVLDRIGLTLRERGEGALVGAALRRAAGERVFGFEILLAPFVVAHLQLGLLLHDEDAGSERRRVGVYLTNALTGWREEDEDEALTLPMAELEEERDAADHVKRDERVLVVLGNPPYNGYAGMGMQEERDLVEPYRRTERAPAPQGQGLNDLYVRFYRMAERRITEMTGRGVVCFISNYSWLDGLSFTGMRERFIDAFDHIRIDALNGDKYRTGKLTPEGEPDPSIFSTQRNREGIQVGTAIGTLVRREPHEQTREIRFRDFWGRRKREELLGALKGEEPAYETIEPAAQIGFPFRPVASGADYLSWPTLPELMPVSFPGVKTSRDEFLVDIDREALESRIEAYFDAEVPDSEIERLSARAMERTERFDPLAVRRLLQARGYRPENIVPYIYRPLDIRWLYWERDTNLLDRNRSDYVEQLFEGNLWLSATQRNRKPGFYAPQYTCVLADHHIVESNVGMFPLFLKEGSAADLFDRTGAGNRVNLSDLAIAHLQARDGRPVNLFHHIVATLHSPDYAAENAGALRQDWPRVPLPASRETLLAGAELGEELARLLDPERTAPGVSAGPIREELRVLGVVGRVGGGELREADLALTAGWGYHGARNAVMPGRGKVVEREYTPDERAAIAAGVRERDLSEGQALALLGERTLDIYLNDVAYWSNVPAGVWAYTLGGYPVVKKWLSYRERDVLGRALKLEEVRYVTEMVRRIAAILLMGPSLDAHYAAVKENTIPLSP